MKNQDRVPEIKKTAAKNFLFSILISDKNPPGVEAPQV
jgi:hypothetical protein